MQIKNNCYCCHISNFYRHGLSYSITTVTCGGPGGHLSFGGLFLQKKGTGESRLEEHFVLISV